MIPIVFGDVINYIIAYYPGESLTGRLNLEELNIHSLL